MLSSKHTWSMMARAAFPHPTLTMEGWKDEEQASAQVHAYQGCEGQG